jgi:hypothetical protein
MKYYLLAMIPVFLLGFGVFGLSRLVKFQPFTRPGQEEEYKEMLKVISIPTSDPNAAKLPILECLEPEYDFGVLPPFVDASYTFTIKNTGDDQLVLKNGKASCSCLDSDLSATLLQPGESKQIVVNWNTDKSGNFAQFVRVLTNSPATPEFDLWVKGRVAVALGSGNQHFDFTGLTLGEERSQNFFLYSDLLNSFSIDRIECSSENFSCREVERPVENVGLAFVQSAPSEHKSRIDLSMTVKAQSVGEQRGLLRIYVRPKLDGEGQDLEDSELSGALGNMLRSDGTMLIEFPVLVRVSKRLSLYGPAITDGDRKLIDLGKLRTTSPAREWSIIAKIRGDKAPSDLKVALTGIKGLTASVEKVENSSSQDITYRLKIHAQEKLPLGIYNREQAGKLTIEAPGLPGEELLEFTVELDVLKPN